MDASPQSTPTEQKYETHLLQPTEPLNELPIAHGSTTAGVFQAFLQTDADECAEPRVLAAGPISLGPLPLSPLPHPERVRGSAAERATREAETTAEA